MIEVQGLTKSYGDTLALSDVTFTVRQGEVVGFLGQNGAGKSTTMRIIAGSLGASSGTARVGGFDVAEDPRKVQAMLGYSPETPPVYTNMTVGDYVRFAAQLKGVSDVEGATKKALGRVGLDAVSHRIIDNLSKGYRQRVGLAQALVHDPRVLVLDEPTSGLDPAQRIEIKNLIHDLSLADDRTVMLSTHVLTEIEAICSRVIIIHRGKIVAQSDLATLAGGAGKLVRIEVVRPDGLLDMLRKVPGVKTAEQEGSRFMVTGETDLREAVASAAVSFGLISLQGERLEDTYIRLTTGVTV
jgi:ABC-2 type transport system ATP-binding protein